MINFTVGPVMSDDSVLRIGAEQVPYFRTEEFSQVMLENEQMVKELAGAPSGSRVLFMTGSGTASMEAVVMHILGREDGAIVINGGSFGQRFEEMLELHEIPHNTVMVPWGSGVTRQQLEEAARDMDRCTALVVNLHETSTGVLYDLPMLSAFCRERGLLFVVDAISAFLADPIDMEKDGIDVLITGSQKALACPPGISLIVLNGKAIQRALSNPTKSYYLDLKSALSNGKRGQTPFTPAVGTLLQIHRRLEMIMEEGGARAEQEKMAALAQDFRDRIQNLPLDFYSESPSNAVTALAVRECSAYDIFLALKNEYGIWICPNGGELKEKVFRVGHLGALTKADNEKLADALYDLNRRGVLR